MDLKNMIQKQQKYIEDNDVGVNSANGDKSIYFVFKPYRHGSILGWGRVRL